MKEKMAGKETKKRLFSGTLALTMILSMMQITSIPVMAATYTNGGLYEGGSGDSGKPAATKTVTITIDDVKAATGNSITKDGVTLTASDIDADECNIMMGGTFTTSSGKITQIEIQDIICTGMGEGWMAYVGANKVTKWTGSASSSVSFDGDIMSMGGHENYTIVITIEGSDSGDSGEPAATKNVTITMDDVKAATGNSITKDGVTLTASDIDADECNIMMGGTFTTSSGKITQIEIQDIICTGMGEGWMAYVGANKVTKWTGSASSSVSFDGDIMSMGGHENYTIVITIETPTGGSTHTHGSWDYTADGATLTAECKADGDCTLTNKKVSLTSTASSANYSGSAATITIGTDDERTAWVEAGLTVPAISYEKANGEALDTAPTGAGSYKAKVTAGEGSDAVTAEVPFTIYANSYTLTVPATAEAAGAGFNAVGNVNVKGNIAGDKKIVVTASGSDNNKFKSTAVSTTVGYTIVKGNAAENTRIPGTGLVFSQDDVNKETETEAGTVKGTSVAVGIIVNEADYIKADDGDYTTTVTWKASLSSASAE